VRQHAPRPWVWPDSHVHFRFGTRVPAAFAAHTAQTLADVFAVVELAAMELAAMELAAMELAAMELTATEAVTLAGS
jgi:hypothetical protein